MFDANEIQIVAYKSFISVFNQSIRNHRIWWPNGRGWRRRLMGSNWGRQLRWGSSQDHFEGLQGPSQRGGHGYIRIRARRKIGGRRQRRQTRQTGRSKKNLCNQDFLSGNWIFFVYNISRISCI